MIKGSLLVLLGGDRFSSDIRNAMDSAESLTMNNLERKLVIAVDYGGKWDIINATKILDDSMSGKLQKDQLNEDLFDQYLSLSDLPSVDLCIRTGGEYRVSNFLLWQAAYTEFYFTDCLWPDFTPEEMKKLSHVIVNDSVDLGYHQHKLKEILFKLLVLK